MSDKIKVLYIDDNQMDRELVRDALETEHGGFDLTEAANRDSFVKALQNDDFDIVMSDFNILGFEGLDVIQTVQEKDPRIPVVIVTGTGSEEIAVQSLKHGAADYVIKQPHHIRRLSKTLLMALEKKKLRNDRETAEKLRDEALNRLGTALKFGNVGLWDWVIGTNQDYFSKEWKRQIGYDDDELEANYEEFTSRLHPEDKDRVLRSTQQYLDDEIPVHDIEFRLQHKDGSYRWIQSQGEVLRDENQQPVRMLGCHIDITERKKAELQIRDTLKEKEVLLHEVHHRVKNNLQVINSLLKLQENDLQNTDFKEMLAECRNRIKAMAYIHENLLDSNDLELIDMFGYLSNLASSVIQTLGADDRLELKIQVDNSALPIDIATPVGQIVNELLSNAVKHGFADNGHGELIVKMETTESGSHLLSVSDTGAGIPAGFDWRNSDRLGLRLVRMLVEEQLNGSINLTNTNGCCFDIRFTS